MPSNNQPGFFICLFNGRAGSSHLFAHLATHSRLHVRNEILARFKGNWDQQVEQLDLVYKKAEYDPGTQQAGLKSKLFDISDVNAFKSYLLEVPQLRILQLGRKNMVRMAISVIRARALYDATGLSNVKSESERPDSIHIDPDLFSKTLISRQRAYKRLDEFVNQLSLPTLKLVYEDLLDDEASYLRCVFDFLNVEHEPTESPLVRNTPEELPAAVSNFEELQQKFPQYSEWFE